MNINTVPLCLKYIRIKRGLSQNDIAKVLQTTQQQIAKYESENPRYSQEIPTRHIITLAKFYGVSADYLLGLSDNPAPNDTSPFDS